MTEEPKLTKKESKKQAQRREAKELHDEWVDENGPGGDPISDIAYRAHLMKIVDLYGLDGNMVVSVTQNRKQAGLEPLDVPKLLFSGELRAAFERSLDEIAEQTMRNKEEAEKAALKKKQRGLLNGARAR